MKHTLRTTAVVTLSVLALSLAGCHSGGNASETNATVTINGEHGKVYNGTAGQVSTQMGQDYAAGLRNMAARQAASQPQPQ